MRAARLLAVLLLGLGSCRRDPPPFVLLISIDTLRADHVGAFGGPAGATPRIDALAAESVLFRRAYSPASFTLPAVSALMTSHYPDELGISENSGRASPLARTMAQWLSAHGWATSAVVSNYVLRRDHGLDAGFGAYDAEFPQTEASRGVPERTGPATTEAALRAADALKAQGKPALLWVHYQDPHGPYTPPDELRARYAPQEAQAADAARPLPVSATQSGRDAIPRYQHLPGHDDPAWYRSGYRGEVAYVDAAVGALLDGLKERGLLQHAVVILTADHGEELGEGGYYFTHGENLSDCLLHVPLLVRVPGRAAAAREDVATLLDVMPTIGGIAQVAPPPGVRGRDLLATTAPRADLFISSLYAKPHREGLLTRDRRYVQDTESGRETLFALGTEGPDLAPQAPESLVPLRSGLEAARRSLVRLPTSRRELTDEEREKFRALGYVDGGR